MRNPWTRRIRGVLAKDELTEFDVATAKSEPLVARTSGESEKLVSGAWRLVLGHYEDMCSWCGTLRRLCAHGVVGSGLTIMTCLSTGRDGGAGPSQGGGSHSLEFRMVKNMNLYLILLTTC